MTHPELGGLPDDLRRALAGKYEVERLLGAGGMGSVYLGRDARSTGRSRSRSSRRARRRRPIRERFLREARTVARLRHPNIVAVYAAGEAERRCSTS